MSHSNEMNDYNLCLCCCFKILVVRKRHLDTFECLLYLSISESSVRWRPRKMYSYVYRPSKKRMDGPYRAYEVTVKFECLNL